ncbi:MAG: DNA polymerase I [Firmicutes bacterium]|nr:DNA polymerase I [Bacillota bacterium]MDD4263423.1 DNA polymerase I [Bacillota bacterium]
MQRMIAIDGHSLLYRAFYALPDFTTKSGQNTGAIYGFNLMLEKTLSDYQPDYVFVAFDSAKPTFRHEIFEDYKAHRPPMPEELRGQVDLSKKLLDHLGIPHIAVDGIEADDLIGTISKLAKKWEVEYLILTGDRDSLQLVDDTCNVLLTKKGISEVIRYDVNKVKEDYSITPDQVIDYKGLVGDASDNIPGVKGIGDKTATKLLKEYGSIENILQNLDKLTPSVLKKLHDQKEIALLSKELATIQTNLDLDISLENSKLEEPDIEPLREFYRELEFTSFLKKLPDGIEKANDIVLLPKLDNFDLTLLKNETEIFLEDMGQDYLLSTTKWWTALSKNKQDLFAENCCDLAKIGKGRKIFTHGAKELYLQDIDLDIEDDLELAGYLLNPDFSHDLVSLARMYLNLEIGEEYEQRAAVVWQLRKAMRNDLVQNDLLYLYEQIELPLSKLLAQMETAGVKVDKDQLAKLSKEFSERIEVLEERIFALAGEEFNVNSSKQLGEILFDKLGLPATKKTKTGYSTSADVLEKLAPIHPLPKYMIEYRQLQKLKSTYTDALIKLINPITQRIHTNFNQMVTATGRLSSSNPNLQNIPIRTEEGAKIRGCFVPEKGFLLLSADYSQIELRVLAHFSGDQDLIASFRHDEDIHARTAAEVLGKNLSEITPQERGWAKAINFGIIYGISSFGLARNTDLTKKQAEEYIGKYLQRYPKVKVYMDDIVETAKQKGYVDTLLGRRRYLSEINSSNFIRRSESERMALNTPIQGTAADIIKIAMLNVKKAIAENDIDAKLILQIHDELVFEVKEGFEDRLASVTKKVMEEAVKLDVPLKVGISIVKHN